MAAFQANAFLISKSFVQFTSSQDLKCLKYLTKLIQPVETRNSMGDAQFIGRHSECSASGEAACTSVALQASSCDFPAAVVCIY
jgi:hypothetical protein